MHSAHGLTSFLQELAHEALHASPSPILWCDGAHAFHPDEFAELNLERGREADDGADRLLVKRCMTPFQWDSTLTQHLDSKLAETGAALVVVHPFNTLWSHEEIQDWEQEDYTRFSLGHLKGLARQHQVPIVLGTEMERWWKTHPTLAALTHSAADARWTVTRPDGRWRAMRDDGFVLDPLLRRQVTLLDYMEEPERAVVTVPKRARRSKPDDGRGKPFRTRIAHPG